MGLFGDKEYRELLSKNKKLMSGALREGSSAGGRAMAQRKKELKIQRTNAVEGMRNY